MTTWQVAVGLGSNMPGGAGSPDEQVRIAARSVLEIPGTELVNASSLYATPPWGVVTQDEFRNAVLRVTTTQSPLEFLHACQAIENSAGRVRTQHWGPRTVDVDLLSFQDATGATLQSQGQWGAELVLPHPYSHRRGFVLVPWAEVGAKDELVVAGRNGVLRKLVEEWLQELTEEETAGIEKVAGPVVSD